jgi:hypothetical protein
MYREYHGVELHRDVFAGCRLLRGIIGRGTVAGKLRAVAGSVVATSLILPWLGCMRPCVSHGAVADPCAECDTAPVAVGGSRAAMAQAGYYNHPRFHPVPTRPVFSPQPHLAGAAGPIVVPESDMEAPTPTATQPEIIPAPSGQSGGHRRLEQTGAACLACRQQSWIFAPAAEPKAVGPEIRTVRQSQPERPLR